MSPRFVHLVPGDGTLIATEIDVTDSVLAERFERHRPRLAAIAYQMLGSVSEADDAVQDAWLRLARADVAAIRDLEGWLVTVVARVCLDTLRSRRAHGRESTRLPEPLVSRGGPIDPETVVLLEEAVGLALLVVLDQLTPAERLAFVLHDVFAVPFDEIATIVGKTPSAARQLASRARRRVRGAPRPTGDLGSQREVATAFLRAAQGGDLGALLTLLDPDVVFRVDLGRRGRSSEARGADAVARAILAHAQFTRYARPVIVNGTPGIVASHDGRPSAVMAFTVSRRRITEIDILADPERLTHVDLGGLDA
jgi:RNA polymerase sigma factor (sigma-70 family)